VDKQPKELECPGCGLMVKVVEGQGWCMCGHRCSVMIQNGDETVVLWEWEDVEVGKG
jgi:hypothetical protein